MWFFTTVLYILIQCSLLKGQRHDTGGSRVPPDLEEDMNDMMYKKLSPEAFFAMKDTQPPVAPLEQHPFEALGLVKPGMKPVRGPMRPGAPNRGPGMGPMRPGAPHMGPGMGPMRPGAPHMGPGMGPMGSGAPHMGPGMRPVGPGAPHMGPGIGPMGPGLRPDQGPGIGPMYDNMGVLAPDGMRGYEHFNLSILDGMLRQAGNPQENFAELETIPGGGPDELIIYNLCFAVSYIWRRGRESIRKYFHLRDLYHNHLPFEVGYITHVIMSKYQTMLELYEFAASLANAPKDTIQRVHLTHFQKTMVEDGLTIQHLVNMLHELKNKYAFRPYDPGNRFDIPGPTTESSGGASRAGIDQGYLDMRIEEAHKVINETMTMRQNKIQEAKEFYKKHGYLPTTPRIKQQPMRLWSPNLDYGWSGEEDW